MNAQDVRSVLSVARFALALLWASSLACYGAEDWKAAHGLTVKAARTVSAYNYTVLQPGRPVAFNLPSVTSPTLYCGNWSYEVHVPQNATRLQIHVVTATPGANVDLFVRYGSDVDLDASGTGVISDHRSTQVGGEETVTITPSSSPPLRAGAYYVALVLWSTEIAVNGTITASVVTGALPPPTPPPGPGPGPGPGPEPILPPSTQLQEDDFYNAVSGQRRGLAPGSIARVVAAGLAPGVQGCVVPAEGFGPLPLLLGDVTVEFGGRWAPILKVCNTGEQGSVTFQVPFELAAGSWPVVIRVKSVPLSAPAVRLMSASPGLYQVRMSDDQRRALVLHPNDSPVSLEYRAQRGELLRVFAVGMGPLAVPIGSNQLGGGQTSELSLRYRVVVGVGNAGAPVVYARYAPNLIGVYEIGFRLPEDVRSGRDVPFVVAADVDGTLVLSNSTTIPVQ